MNDLAEASKSIVTLQTLLDGDMEADRVRNSGSHSRNLLRVKRGLDMVRVLFEQIIISEYVLSIIGNSFSSIFFHLFLNFVYLIFFLERLAYW